MDVYICWLGKVHDTRVFVNSSLYHRGSTSTVFPDWKKTIISHVEVRIYTLPSLSLFLSNVFDNNYRNLLSSHTYRCHC